MLERLIHGLLALALFSSLTACASTPKATPGNLVELSIIVEPRLADTLIEGSRIVITEIDSRDEKCAEAVKDALLRRLIDNTNYTVLSRDNLQQIMGETELSWAGPFNTETANRLGELLGASFHIVGRVAYCGTSADGDLEGKVTGRYVVLAALQVIDLETGKVVMSSSSEGSYIPGPKPLFAQAARAVAEKADADSTDEASESGAAETAEDKKGGGIFARIGRFFRKHLTLAVAQPLPAEETEPSDYAIIKAADDLANSFADKFFARSRWERVEMWRNDHWIYGESVRLVKLGYCEEAVEFLAERASCELETMPEKNVSEYLHNYGVALLCANEPFEAVSKLRAAYRIDYNKSTRKMASTAWQLVEWSLDVKRNSEAEIEILLNQMTDVDRPSCTPMQLEETVR